MQQRSKNWVCMVNSELCAQCINVNVWKVPGVTADKKVVTMEAFTAQQDGDLAFKKGEVLTIVASR